MVLGLGLDLKEPLNLDKVLVTKLGNLGVVASSLDLKVWNTLSFNLYTNIQSTKSMAKQMMDIMEHMNMKAMGLFFQVNQSSTSSMDSALSPIVLKSGW